MQKWWQKFPLVGLCCLFGTPCLATELSETLHADFVLKRDENDKIGLIATYIDKPHLSSVNDLGFETASQSQYNSFGFGPSVELSPMVRAYGVVGSATTIDSHISDSAALQALSLDDNARMYGVGLMITPTEQWSVGVHYQDAQLQSQSSESKQYRYFNLGVGYRF